MVEEQKPKILRLEDCLIDWTHYPAEDENGNPIEEDWSERRDEWLHEDCDCNEYSLANRDKCYAYYAFDYDIDKFREWMRQHKYSDYTIAYWGLERMFDEEWIKSPAFVDWRDMRIVYDIRSIKMFVENRPNFDTRIAILTYFIDNADYLFGRSHKQEFLPGLKNLRTIHKAAAKAYKEELAKESAAQRKSTPKVAPEFVLTLDEIIEYVKTKSPDSAPAIRAMLYDMMLHKEGWNKPSILKKIDSMDVKIVHQGDNIYGNKIGNNIEAVGAQGIGVQENHE